MASATDKARQFIKDLSAKQVRVGWFANNVYPDGTPMALVAYVNEFGGSRTTKDGNTITIPARAPMRTTLRENEAHFSDAARRLIAKGITEGHTVDRVLSRLGMVAVAAVQQTIEDGQPPPNAEATVDGMLLRRKKVDADGNVTYEEYRAGSASKEARTFGQGKGFNSPLIDTSRMMNNVSYVVEDASNVPGK